MKAILNPKAAVCGLILTSMVAGVTGTIHAQTKRAVTKPIMLSGVFQWSDFDKKGRPSETATYRDVFDAPTATLAGMSCHVTTLKPGKEPHPPHKHTEEELLIIKEGTLEVMQKGVTNQVSAGGMVFCASNEIHGWKNATTSPVTYYVLKVIPHDLPKGVAANP